VSGEPVIRPARPDEGDLVAELLYETAGGMYDLFAGSRERAGRILRAAYTREGNSASYEIVSLAEVDGAVAGAIAAFPVAEGDMRAKAFLRVSLARTPPWRWPRTLRVFRLGGELTPPAPGDALYVDALATHPDFRRRGVATALLRAAERRAQGAGLAAVALDTAESNATAQALYEGFGMERSGASRGVGKIPGAIAYLKKVTGDR
jgi:ribosomal protein S18 acetylase RimI-like enzyme